MSIMDHPGQIAYCLGSFNGYNKKKKECTVKTVKTEPPLVHRPQQYVSVLNQRVHHGILKECIHVFTLQIAVDVQLYPLYV